MSQPKITANIGLFYGWQTGDGDWGGPVNWNWLLLDVLVNPVCKSATMSTPPQDPQEGDRYIVAPEATGEWEGCEDQIAYYVTGRWNYFAPKNGWFQRVDDQEISLIYRDGWQRYFGDRGPIGPGSKLRRTETEIQWFDDDEQWQTLILLEDLEGPPGRKGDTGEFPDENIDYMLYYNLAKA